MRNENMYLKIRRNQLGLTQQEVANRAEILLQEYQRLETGTRDIRSTNQQDKHIERSPLPPRLPTRFFELLSDCTHHGTPPSDTHYLLMPQ